MRLLHDYVAVRADKPEEKTQSGILLPSSRLKTFPPYGTVTEVAKGITDVKPGDRVLYKVYASVDIDEDVAVMPISGIIAVIK